MIVIPLADILAAGSLRRIHDCVRADGVIAYPTDTLYGLGAAHAAVDRLKGRGGAPYSAAVGDWAMLESLVLAIPAGLRGRIQGLLPGKFTFLFAPGPAVDPALLKGGTKIGVRMPGLTRLLELIVRLGVPLISTSANRSGRPPLQDPALIAREFPDLDILIDGGPLPSSPGSTVVDLTTDPPLLVRSGAEEPKARAFLAGGRG